MSKSTLKEENLQVVLFSLFIVLVIATTFFALNAFGNHLEATKYVPPTRQELIETTGLDGYCRDQTTEFLRSGWDGQWGETASKGDFAELAMLIYDDCKELNK